MFLPAAAAHAFGRACCTVTRSLAQASSRLAADDRTTRPCGNALVARARRPRRRTPWSARRRARHGVLGWGVASRAAHAVAVGHDLVGQSSDRARVRRCAWRGRGSVCVPRREPKKERMSNLGSVVGDPTTGRGAMATATSAKSVEEGVRAALCRDRAEGRGGGAAHAQGRQFRQARARDLRAARAERGRLLGVARRPPRTAGQRAAVRSRRRGRRARARAGGAAGRRRLLRMRRARASGSRSCRASSAPATPSADELRERLTRAHAEKLHRYQACSTTPSRAPSARRSNADGGTTTGDDATADAAAPMPSSDDDDGGSDGADDDLVCQPLPEHGRKAVRTLPAHLRPMGQRYAVVSILHDADEPRGEFLVRARARRHDRGRRGCATSRRRACATSPSTS